MSGKEQKNLRLTKEGEWVEVGPEPEAEVLLPEAALAHSADLSPAEFPYPQRAEYLRTIQEYLACEPKFQAIEAQNDKVIQQEWMTMLAVIIPLVTAGLIFYTRIEGRQQIEMAANLLIGYLALVAGLSVLAKQRYRATVFGKEQEKELHALREESNGLLLEILRLSEGMATNTPPKKQKVRELTPEEKARVQRLINRDKGLV